MANKRVEISNDELLAAIRHIELTEGPVAFRDFCRAMEISESSLARRFGGWAMFREAAGLPRAVHGARNTGYNRDDIIERLRVIAAREGPDLPMRQFERLTGISSSTILRHFHSWKTLRKLAGLPPQRSRPVTISDDELLEDLDRLDGLLGRFPTWHELRTHSRFGESTYLRRFGRQRDLIRALNGYRIRRELHKRMIRGPSPVTIVADGA